MGGVRSGAAFWALRALGVRDVRNYDGSWYEWAADPRRPVAREGAGAHEASAREASPEVAPSGGG